MRRGIFVAALLAAMPSCLVHAQSQLQNQAPEQVQGEMQNELQEELPSAAPNQVHGQIQDQVQDQVQDPLQNAAPDQAQNRTHAAGQSQSSALAYRGTLVCEKAPGSADILKVPADLAIRGDQVQFARPLLNLRGTRVLGSEMGAGSIDPSGTVHLTSTWSVRGITVSGDYHGTLTQSGGALTGTQSWQGLDGAGHSRTCQVALVSAANANRAAVQ